MQFPAGPLASLAMSQHDTGDRPRRALVTGASSGIGEAFALELASRGWVVTAVARRGDRLDALVAAMAPAGSDHEAMVADLTRTDDLERVASVLADRDRGYELLVNNAGVGTQGRFWRRAIEEELAQIALNVLAPVRLSHAALGVMVPAGRGAIVNISSLSGMQPLPLWSTYSSTKAYLSNFSAAVGAELSGTGVKVLDVRPGYTRTEFQDRTPFSRQVVPEIFWKEPRDVVLASLRDLDRGAAICLPGWQARMMATVTRLSPWPVTRRALAVVTRRLRDREADVEPAALSDGPGS